VWTDEEKKRKSERTKGQERTKGKAKRKKKKKEKEKEKKKETRSKKELAHKRQLTWTVYATPLMTPTTDLGLSTRVPMLEFVRLVTGTFS